MSATEGRTQSTRTVIELRKKILSGELTGGTRLLEVPLSEELDVSRTPLRDAMSRLTEEGLLDRGKNGGFVVRRFTLADIIDAIELRGVLEGTAARLAAERGASAEGLAAMAATVARLDACFGESMEEVDFEAYAENNAQFHQQLATLAGSDILSREIERVTRLPFGSPSAFLPDKANLRDFRRSLGSAQQQHHELLDAISAREGFRAEAIAREHARSARHNLDYALRELKDRALKLPSLAVLVA